jgi:hypothetical protein
MSGRLRMLRTSAHRRMLRRLAAQAAMRIGDAGRFGIERRDGLPLFAAVLSHDEVLIFSFLKISRCRAGSD